jgi:serine/threonine protein kinase
MLTTAPTVNIFLDRDKFKETNVKYSHSAKVLKNGEAFLGTTYKIIGDKPIQESPNSSLYIGEDVNKGNKVGIKVCSKRSGIISTIVRQLVQNETFALSKMRGNKRVVQLLDVFEDDETVFLVLEWCERGDFFTYVKAKDHLAEDEAKHFFKEMVIGVRDLHVNKIAHRDLKLENFLLDKNFIIKICDFNQCGIMSDGIMFKEKRGSLSYCSPTIIEKKPYSGPPEDVWSLGICLYAMIFGIFPFVGKDTETEKTIVKSKLKIPKNISETGKDLIVRMLKKNRQDRISIPEILLHPWLASVNSVEN